MENFIPACFSIISLILVEMDIKRKKCRLNVRNVSRDYERRYEFGAICESMRVTFYRTIDNDRKSLN